MVLARRGLAGSRSARNRDLTVADQLSPAGLMPEALRSCAEAVDLAETVGRPDLVRGMGRW
jgi:hypothetical protein